MDSDRRVVYSTETGSLAKPGKQKRGKKGPAGGDSRAKRPEGVRIRREKKGRGGKTVCVIDGLPLDATALKALLKRLKNSLGTGGTVSDSNIEIQGDHREKLLALLEKEGIKAKLAGG